MTYDCFTFFNELDLLEIRLNTLKDVVDRFVMAEATRTHSGKPKELLFELNRGRFAAFADRISYVVVDDLLSEAEVARDPMRLPWVNENRQRNALARGLRFANGEDVIMVSDLDEIPRPESVRRAVELAARGEVVRLEQDVFMYYLNFKDYRNPRWSLGTVALSKKTLDTSKRLDAVRFDRYTVGSENSGRTVHKVRFLSPSRTLRHAGWHMTYMGGAEAIRRKMLSFAHHEALKPLDIVERRLARGENVLNGAQDCFAVELDGSFPKYVLANRERFGRLIFPVTGEYLEATKTRRLVAAVRGAAYRCLVRLIPSFLERPLSALRRRLFFR